MLKKGDLVLAVTIIAAAALSFAGVRVAADKQSEGLVAVIRQGDKVVKKIDLASVNEPLRITLPGEYHEVVLVEKGRIRFESANCPDQVCVITGWLYRKGGTAVCIPNRAIIKIEGQSDKTDAVTF